MNNKYYYCYSHPQKDFLIIHGMRYVIKGIHPDTKKRYWVFEKCDYLDELLLEWQTRRV